MEYNSLGRTGIAVSPITIGAWQLGGPLFFDGKPDGHPDPGKENVIRMIHELGDLGVNAIDTAEQYSAGESERRVGEALAAPYSKRPRLKERFVPMAFRPTILTCWKKWLLPMQLKWFNLPRTCSMSTLIFGRLRRKIISEYRRAE